MMDEMSWYEQGRNPANRRQISKPNKNIVPLLMRPHNNHLLKFLKLMGWEEKMGARKNTVPDLSGRERDVSFIHTRTKENCKEFRQLWDTDK